MDLGTLRHLMRDVTDGIRVLHTRDGVRITEEQILERARNIVTGLMGNYRIETLDATERRSARSTVAQLDLFAFGYGGRRSAGA